MIITLSFFAFSQCCIIVGFLCFLHSRQSGTRSKTQSFRENAHRLTCCPFLCISLVHTARKSLATYIYTYFIWGTGRVNQKPNLAFNNFRGRILNRDSFKKPILNLGNRLYNFRSFLMIDSGDFWSGFAFFTSNCPEYSDLSKQFNYFHRNGFGVK